MVLRLAQPIRPRTMPDGRPYSDLLIPAADRDAPQRGSWSVIAWAGGRQA
jgi:hypothetical protein